MRYEVYGIYSQHGVNYEAGVGRSLKQALEIARTKVNATYCPAFAILVKDRKFSYPSSILSGSTLNYVLIRSTMLMGPNKYGNPILHESDGQRYWESMKDLFKVS